MAETVTRMVILAEDAEITPAQLVSVVRSLDEPVNVKETCYGLLVEGSKAAVERTIAALRKQAPSAVFSKERGYAIQDKRKCRSGRAGGARGGPRCGFHQLELESRMLDDVGAASESVAKGEAAPVARRRPGRLGDDEVRALVGQALKESG